MGDDPEFLVMAIPGTTMRSHLIAALLVRAIYQHCNRLRHNHFREFHSCNSPTRYFMLYRSTSN